MASVSGVADADADAPTIENWCWSPPTIGHINDEVRTSYKPKVKAVLRHLSVFIDKYHSIPEFNHLGLSPSMDTSVLPFKVIDDEEFVGRWVTFLADEAKHLDGSNNLLSLSLASEYASTFASYYINHYRNESDIPRPLKKELWNSLRKASFNKKSGGVKCHLGSHSMK